MAIDLNNGVIRERRQVWTRASEVTLAEGWARIIEDWQDPYEPSAHPNLPSLFAKATTDKEVERFLRLWGLLGFWALLDAGQRDRWPEKYRLDAGAQWEPVDWIIAQARTVEFALKLVEALKAGNKERLERVLAQRRLGISNLENLIDGGPPLGRYAHYYVAKGGGYGGEGGKLGDGQQFRGGWYQGDYYPVYDDDRGLERHAEVIVAELVNANTEGVREHLWVDYHRGFGLEQRGRGLIELIWVHLRNAALGAGEIRRCLECGAPFIVTDRRQQFCPPDLPGTKSRCAGRSQKRRQRGPRS